MIGRGIFISYRREDTRGDAGRLDDRLRGRYGTELVFRDVHDSPPGISFPQHLERSVTSCRIVIVVVGARWLASMHARLSQPDDWVRLEIRTALNCLGVTVIPVLMNTEAMPQPDELPDDIRSLSTITAQQLSDTRWDADMSRLYTVLDPLMWPQLPGHRGDRLPTSWTRKMRLAVAGWMVTLGIAALIVMSTWFLSGNFATDVEPVLAPYVSAEEFSNLVSDFSIVGMIIAVAIAALFAFLAFGSYRGWRWIFWFDLVFLALAAFDSLSTLSSWTSDILGPRDLILGALPSLLLTVTSFGLFMWMIIGMIRFGPGAWSTRQANR